MLPLDLVSHEQCHLVSPGSSPRSAHIFERKPKSQRWTGRHRQVEPVHDTNTGNAREPHYEPLHLYVTAHHTKPVQLLYVGSQSTFKAHEQRKQHDWLSCLVGLAAGMHVGTCVYSSGERPAHVDYVLFCGVHAYRLYKMYIQEFRRALMLAAAFPPAPAPAPASVPELAPVSPTVETGSVPAAGQIDPVSAPVLTALVPVAGDIRSTLNSSIQQVASAVPDIVSAAKETGNDIAAAFKGRKLLQISGQVGMRDG